MSLLGAYIYVSFREETNALKKNFAEIVFNGMLKDNFLCEFPDVQYFFNLFLGGLVSSLKLA